MWFCHELCPLFNKNRLIEEGFDQFSEQMRLKDQCRASL